MKVIPIKGIILGTLISLLLGFVIYVVAAIAGIYLNGLQRTRTSSDEAVEVINAFLNSQEVYIFSFPVTFLQGKGDAFISHEWFVKMARKLWLS